jgi:hypothetical protein
MPLCRSLTSSLTPQQSNDASTLEKSIKKCDQKRSQGKIVDFLNKQAQQPASDTTSGLRPRDVHALSSGTKKRENYPDLIDSASVVSASGHRPINPGCLPKVVVGTNQPRSVSCELCLLSTSFIYYVKAATSNVTIDSNCSEVTQNFGTSRSPVLSQSARSSSTLVSIGNSPDISRDIVASGPSSNALHGAVILPQYQVHSTPPTTQKMQHVSSSLVNQVSITAHNHLPYHVLSFPKIFQFRPLQ